jgi:hypothetical protein
VFSKDPQVLEVKLQRPYGFMYEHFAVLTQGDAYLLLESSGDSIFAIQFSGVRESRYGGPNDEAHGAHPLTKHGLGAYGFFEVKQSPRIRELMIGNRVHPSHSDSLFSDDRHFIACFKDLKFECICDGANEVTLTRDALSGLIAQQVAHLASAG